MNNLPRFTLLVAITMAAAAARLVPHPPNVAPIAAMALFGGAHFAGRFSAFAIPLVAMLLSDLALGLFVYGSAVVHPVLPFVYVGFAMIVLLGRGLRSRSTPLAVLGASLAASVLFFLITNLGVWLVGGLYPKTPEGLAACYTAAIPFFRNTLLGDLAFTTALFGAFALAQQRVPSLRERPVSV